MARGLAVTSSNSAAFAALGFGAVATQPPLGIAGTAVNNQATTPGPVTGATLLSGAAGTDSLAASFGLTDTITVNGTSISFVASGATGNQLNLTDSVQTMLAKIDSITGTTIPSTVSGGVVTLRSNAGSSLTVTTTNSSAFTALGLNTPSTATLPPLQVAGGAATNKAAVPGPISSTTLLSGVPSTNSLGTNFAAGDIINVNGTPITFMASGAAGNQQVNVTDNIQTLLSKIDALTGTTVPSTINNGVITLNSSSGAKLSVTSTNAAAFGAMGLGAAAPAAVPPLRVAGSPLGAATSQVSGTPANTVTWYTGQTGPGSARASATSRVDQSVTVQYGIRADEQAIRSQLQTLAVYATVTTSPTNPNGAAAVLALSQRVANNLIPVPGQQTIQDIQADLATAQSTMKDASARQTQSQAMLQSLVDQAETVSPDQVASQILALQTALQASYQTTSMLSQLTLTRYLPVG